MAEPDFSFLDPDVEPIQAPRGRGGRGGRHQLPEPPAESAEVQAQRIRLLLDAGLDKTGMPIIHKVYEPTIGQGSVGFLGSTLERLTRGEVFPTEVEELLGPEHLDLIEKYYGAPEVDIPREDASWFTRNVAVPLIGRLPSESELEAEKIASARGGTASFFSRYFREKLDDYVPTPAEIRGDPPEGASPAETVLYERYGYDPRTDPVKLFVDFREYGRVPVKKPEEFKEVTQRANDAIRFLAQLPKGEDASGKEYSVAEDLIGQILLTDINIKYGTDDLSWTLEDLNLQMKPTADGPRLTFDHPTEGNQPIDPITFDWSDVIDVLPEAYIIFGDVAGAIAGGVAGGLAGPVTAFGGATAGGAVGATVSKFLVMEEAFRIGGFTLDSSKNAWVSHKTGKEQIIPLTNWMGELVSEAAWSAGGAVLGSTIFRIGKAIFTKGGSEAESFVRKEDWDDAYRRWGESKFGKKFASEGIESPALILERAARELRELASTTVGKESRELVKRADRMDASASQFRAMEDILPEAQVARQQMLHSLDEGTRTLPDGTIIRPANYDDASEFGSQVQAAIRSGDGTRINNLLDSMTVANRQLIEDWRLAFKGTGEGTEAAFGRNIREAAEVALGTAHGVPASKTLTGIYGSLNLVRAAAQKFNAKIFDITRVSKKFESDLGSLSPAFKGDASAYPVELKKLFLDLRDAAAGKDGVAVTYSEIRQLSDRITEAVGKATGENKRRLLNLKEMLKKVEGQGLKRLDPVLYKKWKVAHKDLRAFHSIWKKQFDQGMTDLNTDQLANKFLKSMNDDTTISEILSTFKGFGLYGREQEDLLRNVLRTRLRNVLLRELKPGEGVEISGATRTVKMGGLRFAEETVTGAKFDQFLNDYGPWVRQLFPNDPKLEEFAKKIVRSDTLKSRYARIEKMEKALKDLPFLRSFSTGDLQQLAIHEPHKLYDLIWQTGRSSTDNTKSIRELNRILKRGLSSDEYSLAQARFKTLTLSKIYNPDVQFTAASGKQLSARDITESSVEFLNRERTALAEVFGPEHFDNLRLLFKEMNEVANPREMGVAGRAAMYRADPIRAGESGLWQDIKRLPGFVAKIWVGVLNRKARALNLGTKIWMSGEERAFTRLLSDPKALDQALKIRASKVNPITANALGSVLLGRGPWSESDIEELLDNYTITDAQGNRQPIPIQSKEESVNEAIERILE